MSVDLKMTAIADAIRGKTGGTTALTLDQMATEIENMGGVEECTVACTAPASFSLMGGICYTKVGSDGKITSASSPLSYTSSGVSGSFRCVKGSAFIVQKGSMPATSYTATVTGSIAALKQDSTTGYTIMVFRVDGDGTITLA